MIAMSLPEKIKFESKTNQGSFSGFYDTQTTEIDAEVVYGGNAVAGLVDIKKPKGTFHVIGKEANGWPEAQVDGKKLEVVNPPR